MTRREFVLFGVLTVGWAVWIAPVAAAGPWQEPEAASPSPVAAHEALLQRYCITCHNERLAARGTVPLALQTADLADVPGNAEVWEKVIRKLRTGSMPPAGRPRPEAAASDGFAAWLETGIDRVAAARPNPGRTEPLHRLNRTEYQNAVRDLLAFEVDAAALVPADDQSYGFDNIAGVLKVSPTLLERYMNAARTISRLAVGASEMAPAGETFRIISDLSQYQHRDGLPFGTRGGMSVEYNFPRDAEYELELELLDLFAGAPIREPHQLELSLDGERVAIFHLTPPDPDRDQGAAYNRGPDSLQARVQVGAGPRVVTAAFIKKTSALAESVRQPFDRPHGEGDYLLYQPHLGTLTISGPFNAISAGDTPSRSRIFVCRPADAAAETPCAREIIASLARRAYRRPVTAADVSALLTFYDEGRAVGGFEAGIERAVRALLVSPDFLFRVVSDPAGTAPGAPYRLSDLELASRISFFLWSSIPDDELLDVAAEGRLREPGVLERQVRRMLADPRSEALARNFAGQWLRLRNISGALPSDVLFPDFGESLRQDFVRETELFFDSVMREDRSVTELLTADYTFLNERLARHYGMSGVYGSDFRRVTLGDPNRRGLLGQGSILTVTSYSDRTSPVGRGKWVLENVLGTAAAPAAAQRAGAGTGRGCGQGAGDARADGAASRESGLRELPSADGSAGAGPGELRRSGPLARPHARGHCHRCVRGDAGRHAVRWPGGSARAARQESGAVRDGRDREAVDLRARPRRRVLRRARGAGDNACGGRARLRSGVTHCRRREEHAVPDAAGPDRRGCQLSSQQEEIEDQE